MHQSSDGRKRALAIAGIAFIAGCVSPQQYDESVGLAKSYQTQLHDLQAAYVTLEDENERLKAELRAGAMVQPAGFSEEMEARVSELQALLDALGRPPGDIERFDVDGGYVYMIQDKVLFASGSAEIGAEGQQALTGLAREIGGAPHGRIFVRGHTDSDPVKRPETKQRFPHGNLELSAARAVAVAALLIEQGGVEASDVVIAGYGQWEPVAANDSAENKRLNRRVEIFVADEER